MTKAIFPLIAIIMQFILNPSAHAHPSEMVTHKNSMHKTIEEWDKVAIRDIKKVHDIISETHPAKLDEENLEFNHWLEFGYQKSLLLAGRSRSEEHTSELQSQSNLVCRLLLEKKKKQTITNSKYDIT